MQDILILMHDDAPHPVDAAAWGPYLATLVAAGQLQGGSAIGPGLRLRQGAPEVAVEGDLGGYIRVSVENLDAAKALLAGNPVFEAGGTVEVRSLPRTD